MGNEVFYDEKVIFHASVLVLACTLCLWEVGSEEITAENKTAVDFKNLIFGNSKA